MVKKLSTLMLFSMLTACVAKDPGSSSSDAQSSSSDAQSSSPQTSSSSSAPAVVETRTGEQIYSELGCKGCHDDDGLNELNPIVFENWNINSLTQKIHETMPPKLGPYAPELCEDECARRVAEYVLSLKPVVSCNSEPEPLPQRLRMLTNREYANTINDLLGRNDGFEIINTFEADTRIAGYDNNVDGSTATIGRIDGYWAAAEKIADSQSNITQLLNCGQQQQNPTQDDVRRCADTFIPRFGEKVFRRPLTNDEVTAYKEVFNLASTREDGFKYALQAFLSSPNFLYRSEIGAANNGNFKLTAYEIASLLSYTFWGTMPDDNLLQAAKDGHLNDINTLRQQAERLLSDERAKAQFAHFGRQWFRATDLSAQQKDPALFPDYDDQIAELMDRELELFLGEVFLGNSGNGLTAGEIYTANFTYLNNELAQYYGMNNVSTSNFQKVTVDSQRAGLLTKGAVLTINAARQENHPIKRGLLIRRNLLCQEFGTPPANIGEVEPLAPNKPLRERLLAHSSNAACASCHVHIDPLGFAFEHYDATGRYRTFEGNNLPIDSEGSLIGIASMADIDEHHFNDLQGLANILATEGSNQIALCAAEQYQRYFKGIAEPDSCEVSDTVARWQGKSDNLVDLWLAPLADPNFAVRK